MKFLKITLIILFLIVSVGFVSAQDTSNDTLESEQTDIYATDEFASFNELEDAINNANDTLEITKDYGNDNYPDGITINKDNLVINGNNHTIDGNNQNIFLNKGNLTLNNLIFANAQYYDAGGGAIYNKGTLTLNNVTFINSTSIRGGAIYNDGTLILNNVTFINNAADFGGAIYNRGVIDVCGAVFVNNHAGNVGGAIFNNGVLDLDNADFNNNSADCYGGALSSYSKIVCRNSEFADNVAYKYGSAIYLTDLEEMVIVDSCYFESKYANKSTSIFLNFGNLLVNNSVFANISATHAPAIFAFIGSVVIINNTHFVNLKSSQTAGAVAIKEFENVTIENSRFINTSSFKNGGAVFIDSSDDYLYRSNVSIHNTSFINASGDFGGAYLQLQGLLSLSNSTFINCSSKYDGGAIYMSLVNATINDSTFISNENLVYGDYPTYGGVIYFDLGNLKLYNSRFFNNLAYEGSGMIGIYDSVYHVADSILGDGEAIHAIFKGEGSEVVNCCGNYTICDDNVFYPHVVINQGVNFTLITNEINLDTLPIRFDLRDYNWTTPVKNQGFNGACWAFAANAALESVIWRSSDLNDSYSVSHMQTSMIVYSKYGNKQAEGGTPLISAAYLLDWFGPISEKHYPTDELTRISPLFPSLDVLHIQDVLWFYQTDTQDINWNQTFKQAILKYGAIHASIYGDATGGGENDYYNSKTFAQYVPDDLPRNHAVCVVGWDDTFSADNFIITPPDDGAWICKNSYGTGLGDEGYFYVSYYDKTILRELSAVFLLENTISYNKNYQYDFAGLNDFYERENDSVSYGAPVTYANRFISLDDDLLAAVGTYFNQSGVNYTVTIEVNGETVHSQEGVSPYFGYHTIELDNYIPIKKGDEFVVYMTSNLLPYSYSPRLHYEDNVSMTDAFGNWSDMKDYYSDRVVCLKAYTVGDDSAITGNENVSVEYASQSRFTVKVVTGDGHPVTGASVNFTINGKTEYVLSDCEGIAGFEISELPGSYVVMTSYANKTYRNNVTVTLNRNACKLLSNDIKADYGGGSYFAVKVLSADGKVPVAGESVIIVFNGKVNTLRTDKNGIAKVKITELPKKYSVTTVYKGKTYKNTLTVKQVLTTGKVTVKKTAAKFTLKAKLKINGKPVKGKWITFKFNGKTYKAKTNSKGIAQKSFNKNFIKKLRKGKTYAVKVTYLKDTIKSGVKVK